MKRGRKGGTIKNDKLQIRETISAARLIVISDAFYVTDRGGQTTKYRRTFVRIIDISCIISGGRRR